MARIGVIADTHGLLRPEVFEVFREVAGGDPLVEVHQDVQGGAWGHAGRLVPPASEGQVAGS